MDDTLTTIYQTLQERHGTQVRQVGPEANLFLTSENYIAVMQSLKDEFGFNRLSGITAVDYWPESQPRMHLCIHLHSLTTHQRVAIRLPLDGDALNAPTLTGVYANANWYEREVADMFGVTFEGHPDPRRIIMPQDWKGHPLRKDYPLGYEEVQFTFNFDKIDARKIYAKK